MASKRQGKKGKNSRNFKESRFSIIHYSGGANYTCAICRQPVLSRKVIIYHKDGKDRRICERCYEDIKEPLTANTILYENSKVTVSPELFQKGKVIYVGNGKSHKCQDQSLRTLIDFEAQLIDIRGKKQNFRLKKCNICGKVFMCHKTYSKWSGQLPEYEFVTEEKLKIAKHVIYTDSMDFETFNVNVNQIGPKDFLTRPNVFHCMHSDHQLIDLKCDIKILRDNGSIGNEEVPAAYCPKCDSYYILEPEYQRLKKKGIILCKVVEQEFWQKGSSKNQYNLNQESLLHIMGYNVNAQKNLSQSQRWGILEVIVDEKIMSRIEIASHLDYLINRSKYRRNLGEAVSKWRTDRNHIINYNGTNMKKIKAECIIKNTYH